MIGCMAVNGSESRESEQHIIVANIFSLILDVIIYCIAEGAIMSFKELGMGIVDND
jgi:hypothetical protein